MIIKKLSLTNLRAYTEADFEFQPGMNLLVGVNGVGKTTALDVLRICLSHILPEVTASRNRKETLTLDDIKFGKSNLQVSCDFVIEEQSFNLLIHRQRESVRVKDNDSFRDQVEETPDFERITPSLKTTFPRANKQKEQPLGIFFSTKRSLIVDQAPGKTGIAGGQAAAFADALSTNREFNLRIFTNWLRAQMALGKETPAILKNVAVMSEAIYRFLPGFYNLEIRESDEKYFLTIDKGGTTLHVNQLSDGEKGMLSLVMDIARRLSQANPGLDDPLTKGNAVILIDELDLHLHPKWQRSIVQNLIRVFPNCQFIATTHSPQIIPALVPERIHIISDAKTVSPVKSLGMDTNWVLKYLMETDDRPEDAGKAIEVVEQLIAETEFDKAREKMGEYKKKDLDLPEWAVFEARMARLEIIDDEE